MTSLLNGRSVFVRVFLLFLFTSLPYDMASVIVAAVMLYIELARRQKRWTQKDLGDTTRIDQHFVSMVKRRIGLPTPDQHERLARALDLPYEKLLQPVPDAAEVAALTSEAEEKASA
jgi:hypothetical protein